MIVEMKKKMILLLFCVAIIEANAQYFSAQTPYDQWRDSLQLLDGRHRASPWPRRFPANVDQGRTGLDHGLRMAQGKIALVEAATVGEGVGSDIENTHDVRLGQIEDPVAARQPGGVLRRGHVKP